MSIQNTRDSRPHLLAVFAAALLLAPLTATSTYAGAYIFAGESFGTDIILHPQGYNGSQTILNVEVCLDPATLVPTDAVITDIEKAIQNNIAIWNQLQPIVGNSVHGSANNIIKPFPNNSNVLDFESVALHELGHCIGLAHVNAANESLLPVSDRNYTKATDGINNAFNILPGVDGVIGTLDDVRGDDVNLHWFRTDTNDPGELPLPVPVDNTTYDRDQSSLPVGHLFAQNLDRTAAGVMGHPSALPIQTEAVMQQGTFVDEDQRRLTADGVGTILLAMSGTDETAGTADDYVLNLTYGGISDAASCDLTMRFADITPLAYCSVSGGAFAANHWRIGPNRFMEYNINFNWFFNQDGACRQTLDLVTGQWKQMALSCEPPAGANTVADLLGDDLTGTYDVNWVVWERDAVNNNYYKLPLTEPLLVGRGYWIKTDQSSQTIKIEGDFNTTGDFALHSDPAGRWNMVGHRYWYDEAWADVLVVDPDDPSSPLTLAEADPAGACQGPNPLANGCVMSRIAHKWDGGDFEVFDGHTPGLGGTLENFDGFWVKAYKSGISLRIPDQKSTPSVPHNDGSLQSSAGVVAAVARDYSLSAKPVARVDEPNGWFIRLIAESGALRDDANVFGLLADSVDGYDWHDLEELSPFGSPYLTIVFPHEDWGSRNGAYASDYRGFDTTRRDDIWNFEVRASDADMEVTLSWEGGDSDRFRNASLTDLETGANVPVSETGSYTFKMGGESHRFRWTQNRH